MIVPLENTRRSMNEDENIDIEIRREGRGT